MRLAIQISLDMLTFRRCHYLFWSSHSQKSFKIGVLKNFANFTRKHLFLFNKVAGLRAATLLKRCQHRCFPVKSEKLLRTPFFTEQLQWLLLLFIAHPFVLLSTELFLARCKSGAKIHCCMCSWSSCLW